MQEKRTGGRNFDEIAEEMTLVLQQWPFLRLGTYMTSYRVVAESKSPQTDSQPLCSLWWWFTGNSCWLRLTRSAVQRVVDFDTVRDSHNIIKRFTFKICNGDGMQPLLNFIGGRFCIFYGGFCFHSFYFLFFFLSFSLSITFVFVSFFYSLILFFPFCHSFFFISISF